MSRIEEEVEKFIRRYYDLEILINPDARRLEMDNEKRFADLLQRTIIEYMLNHDEQTSDPSALFAVITKAYSYGVISSGQDLLGKLEECKKENKELRRDIAICLANYTALQTEHARLVKMIDQNQNPTGDNDEQTQKS